VPPEQSLEWSQEGVQGSSRFLKRLWRAAADHISAGPVENLDIAVLDSGQKDLRRQLHMTIAKVGDDVGRRYTFNTAIAAIMELMNSVQKFDDQSSQGRAVVQEVLDAVVLMLSPIVPHVTHALWLELGHKTAVVDELWPDFDTDALAQDTVEIIVQVNGKLRGRVAVAADADKKSIEGAALADVNVQRFIADKKVRRVIVVPGKLVNVVV
jgi:leucyl-tRNA synthetase